MVPIYPVVCAVAKGFESECPVPVSVSTLFPRELWKQLVVNGRALSKVLHSVFVGGVKHCRVVHAGPSIGASGTRRMNTQILPLGNHVLGRFGMSGAVHGEHASALTAAEGGVE